MTAWRPSSTLAPRPAPRPPLPPVPAAVSCWFATPSASTRPTSTREKRVEILRNRPVRRLCRADLAADGGSLVRHHRPALDGGPLRPAAACLAPGIVRLLRLHHRAVVDGPGHRPLRPSCPHPKPRQSMPRSSTFPRARRLLRLLP